MARYRVTRRATGRCVVRRTPAGTVYRVQARPDLAPETAQALDTLVEAAIRWLEQAHGDAGTPEVSVRVAPEGQIWTPVAVHLRVRPEPEDGGRRWDGAC